MRVVTHRWRSWSRPRSGYGGAWPVVLAGLALAVRPLAGQAVRGQLVDRSNGFPIGGAFVVLLDQQGTEVARVLTGDAGSFLIRAPGPGTYRLQSKRIGFRMQESLPIVLAEGQTVSYRLEVEAVPARLPPVVVEGRPQCGSRGDEGSAVAQLWEEAREALAAVRWTEGQRVYDYTLELFERDLAPAGQRVEKERTWARSGSAEVPFRSLPAESLAAYGYVVGNDREGRTYYAPDAGVLLSDVFLEDHCFTARQGSGELAGLVGLAFVPAPRRRLPDVRGVLWLDRETAELRFLEYRYANLPAFLPEGALGGRVEFLRLENGAWIVLDWSIRMPLMGLVVDRSSGRPRDPTVLGFRERGGKVTAIRTSSGALVYSAGVAILGGTVVDSTRQGARLARAAVEVAGTPYRAVSDADGRFQISAPLEGTYAAIFRHPRLDSLGITPDPQPVALARGRRASVVLAIPPEPRIVERLCPGGMARGERVLTGVVRDATGRPVAGAEVLASWQAIGGAPGAPVVTELHAAAAADSAGRYVLCGMPPARLRLSARAGQNHSAEVVLEFSASGVWIEEREYRSAPGRIWTQDLALRR